MPVRLWPVNVSRDRQYRPELEDLVVIRERLFQAESSYATELLSEVVRDGNAD